jgi:hypothetical protein
MKTKRPRKNKPKHGLSYFLNGKFKVHDNVVFHEVGDYILVTTLDRVEVVYKLTGFFANLLKLIFFNAAHGVQDLGRVIESFDAENSAVVAAHADELEENLARLYRFLISNGFLEERSSRNGRPPKSDLGDVELDRAYRIGRLKSEITLLKTDGSGYALTDEELTLYVAGTMTACSSY